MTLYRLLDGTTLGECLGYVHEHVLRRDPQIDQISIDEASGVLVHAAGTPKLADWCADVRRITGVTVGYEVHTAGALLFIEVDGCVYAIGYGNGYLWLDDAVKDPRFGLNFAIRCLDCDQISDLVRRVPGARGRTDSSLVPGGASIWHLGVEQHADIVRRLGGKATQVPLTFSQRRGRGVSIEGAAGLKIPLGVAPAALVADIRAIADVCRRGVPHPDLAFVENIQPTTSKTLVADLDTQLDQLLGREDVTSQELTLAVPQSALNDLSATAAFRVRIGTAAPRIVPQLDLDVVLRRTRLQSAGRRVDALRAGTIELLASTDGSQSFGSPSAIKWVEATASLGARRFFLMEGQWYELGTGYHDDVRRYVANLLSRNDRSLDLPAWQAGDAERDYNLHVAAVRRDYVCLDRHGVTTRLHKTNGVEICDLLGPDDELIHVKKASGSAPLSHLFAQGLVSAQTLINSSDARKKFAALVEQEGSGRTIPEDFVPKKIVYAILLKRGERLTTDSLFPFAQVMLRQAALYLDGKAQVEVIPIEQA